jgi:Ca-activated chloride channel family protein
MEITRSHWIAAGTLLLATALVGAATHGKGGPTITPFAAGDTKTFTAPANGRVSFSRTLDRTAVLRGHDGIARMELVIAAAADEGISPSDRPTDMVIVLDRSGSMMGEKIVHARAAVRELLGQLRPGDRFALVAYSDGADLVVPLESVSAATRTTWAGFVDDIQPGGSTNMASGLDLGFSVIESGRLSGRVPHMILLSDGLANTGDASHEGLTRRARRAAQGEFMLSTVGVGTDFNEALMTALADSGTGNYYYLRTALGLADVFAREFSAARTTVASALAVQIEPAPGVQILDAAGYPLEATPAGVVFRPGSLFAGQQRRIWVTVAMPHDTVGAFDLGRISLSYSEGPERRTLSFSDTPRIACVEDERQFYSNVDVPGWTRSVVVDAYSKMQEDVAREIQAGRRDEALRVMRGFGQHAATMNERLQSPQVTEQLRELHKLETDVQAAFTGIDQKERQNEMSKHLTAEAVDARRAGSKK